MSPGTSSAAGRVLPDAVAADRGRQRQPRLQGGQRRLRAPLLEESQRGVEYQQPRDDRGLDILASAAWSTIAASSIQGTGAQNFASAMREVERVYPARRWARTAPAGGRPRRSLRPVAVWPGPGCRVCSPEGKSCVTSRKAARGARAPGRTAPRE